MLIMCEKGYQVLLSPVLGSVGIKECILISAEMKAIS